MKNSEKRLFSVCFGGLLWRRRALSVAMPVMGCGLMTVVLGVLLVITGPGAPVLADDAVPDAAALVAMEEVALAAGDASAGRKVFKKSCRNCHRVRAGKHNSFGPNLHGVVGRKAGAVEQFDYSAALAATGYVWTPDRIDTWLTDPRKMVPGTAMKFILKKPADRANLIAYLVAAGRR